MPTDAEPRRSLSFAPEIPTPAVHAEQDLELRTVFAPMRDGTMLATDLYLPPGGPAPVIAHRTPYGRTLLDSAYLELARRGYAVVAQDCRGTGDSEPDQWQFAIFEREDGYDCVEWITAQDWYGDFVGSIGGSYCSGTQWGMAEHPAHSTAVHEVGGLHDGPAVHPRLHMFVNAYSKSVGKGDDVAEDVGYEEMERRMVAETLATGFFDDPISEPPTARLLARYPEIATMPDVERKEWLWRRYAGAPPEERAALLADALDHPAVSFLTTVGSQSVFGHRHRTSMHWFPTADLPAELGRMSSPGLVITGWYDWNRDDSIAMWQQMVRDGGPGMRDGSRLLVTPSAHNALGYREGPGDPPELSVIHRTANIVEVLLGWFRAVRGGTHRDWDPVTYYLTGANEWRGATAWPPGGTESRRLHLGPGESLTEAPPTEEAANDQYRYDPLDPPPTVGGSVVSSVVTPGSADVSEVQARPDVLVYSTPVLARDLDVVGAVELVLYAASSAIDTDFSARISDVFPDGRALQLPNATVHARHRDPDADPRPLVPGEVERFRIRIGNLAHRFRAGHRLRLDIASADFPKYERNTNGAGTGGGPVVATQTVVRDASHPSHIVLDVLP